MAQFNEINNMVPNPPKRAVPRPHTNEFDEPAPRDRQVRELEIHRLVDVYTDSNDYPSYCCHGVSLTVPCEGCMMYYAAKAQAARDREKVENSVMNHGIAGQQHVSESGATSSHVPLRYDLIPRQLLECSALRYTVGVEKHTERGYHRGLADRDFIINRINHIQEHWMKLLHPNSNSLDVEDFPTREGVWANIGAMIWGLGFLLEVADNDEGAKILGEILIKGQIKFK